ncbi:LPS export ABC transporter periplasmic protein LptC [Thioalkalivibrio sp.]|uniref:LPS export ABC transporter periplasmic protein LptC n=1 Tax=Thioalkalivibrio sp. TaxID=2093813 RepID=UPI0035678CB8
MHSGFALVLALPLALLMLMAAPRAAAEVSPPEGEVTLQIDGFTLHATGEDGEQTHRLQGTRLREFGRDGPQWVDDPDLDLFADGGIEWRWTAPAALHRPADETLDLVGPTHGVQPARGERVQTVIDSRDVRIATDTMVAISDALSTLDQPSLFQRGTGLRVDSRADTIELFHDVYSLYSETSEEDPAHDPESP